MFPLNLCDHYTKLIIHVSNSKTLHVLSSRVSDCYTPKIPALIVMKFHIGVLRVYCWFLVTAN